MLVFPSTIDGCKTLEILLVYRLLQTQLIYLINARFETQTQRTKSIMIHLDLKMYQILLLQTHKILIITQTPSSLLNSNTFFHRFHLTHQVSNICEIDTNHFLIHIFELYHYIKFRVIQYFLRI